MEGGGRERDRKGFLLVRGPHSVRGFKKRTMAHARNVNTGLLTGTRQI